MAESTVLILVEASTNSIRSKGQNGIDISAEILNHTRLNPRQAKFLKERRPGRKTFRNCIYAHLSR